VLSFLLLLSLSSPLLLSPSLLPLLAFITSLSDHFNYLCESDSGSDRGGDSGGDSGVRATVGMAVGATAGASVRVTKGVSVRMRATARATAVPYLVRDHY